MRQWLPLAAIVAPRRALQWNYPLGDAVDTFIRHEDAERFIEESATRRTVVSYPRIEERELEPGGAYENDRPLTARFSLAPARTSRRRACRT
jgi:hypothetical protein